MVEALLLLALIAVMQRGGGLSAVTGKNFATEIFAVVKPMTDARGYDSNAARLLTGQAMFETADGFQIKDSNAWNITAGPHWRGPTIGGGDRDAAGNAIQQKFRAYSSFIAAGQDLFTILDLPRYNFANTLLKQGNENYIEELGRAGWYALEPAVYHARMSAALARFDRYAIDWGTV